DQIHLLFLQSSRQQTEIHDAWSGGELQAVCGHQPLVPVGTLHELVAKSGTPLRRVRRRLREGLKCEAACILSANYDGECVVETEGRPQREMEATGILILNAIVDGLARTFRLLLQDRGQRRARVLGINVDPSSEDRLMADEASCQIET